MYVTLFYYSLLSRPKLLPLWSVPDRRTKFFTPCSLNKGFFLLSARGPTRRRNSTGQAVLWGGRPTELGTTNARVGRYGTYHSIQTTKKGGRQNEHQNDVIVLSPCFTGQSCLQISLLKWLTLCFILCQCYCLTVGHGTERWQTCQQSAWVGAISKVIISYTLSITVTCASCNIFYFLKL
jgi:hypothetical protein